MAFFKIYARFSEKDYCLRNSENGSEKVNVCGRVSNHKGSGEALWNREHLRKTFSIIRVYNDHSWQASSVVARNGLPEIGSLYFAKQDAATELQLLRAESHPPSAVIAEPETAKNLSTELSIPIYEVKSLIETARLLADIARLRTSATIIGVTGSVGKTSLKDALARILSIQGSTHATGANANDGWGVLNTLMNLPKGARYAVMELGRLGVGSIKIKSERIKPHVGIITNIHDAHLAYHDDERSIARTKSGLFDGLVPGGVAILPRDSAWYDFLKNKAEQASVHNIITFGAHPEADFRLMQTVVEHGKNIVHANLLGKPVEFRIGTSGDYWGFNAMAILAAAHATEADIDAAISAMASIKPSFRRGEVHLVNADSKKLHHC